MHWERIGVGPVKLEGPTITWKHLTFFLEILTRCTLLFQEHIGKKSKLFIPFFFFFFSNADADVQKTFGSTRRAILQVRKGRGSQGNMKFTGETPRGRARESGGRTVVEPTVKEQAGRGSPQKNWGAAGGTRVSNALSGQVKYNQGGSVLDFRNKQFMEFRMLEAEGNIELGMK